VVTFSLAGFSTVRREGIELTGSFAASVNAQMAVGALQETITVIGETPVVDVINARQQSIVDNELISAIPTPRLRSGSRLGTQGSCQSLKPRA
jgi:hypothetical protein